MKHGFIIILPLIICLSWNKPDFRFTENKSFHGSPDTSVCDKVFDGKFDETSQTTTLNLGGISAGQIRILIKGKDRNNFPSPPEKLYLGKTVCVKGPVETHDGQLSIIIKDPGQIVVQQ